MAAFVFDVLVFYFSNSFYGLFLIVGFCILCLAGVLDLIYSCLGV